MTNKSIIFRTNTRGLFPLITKVEFRVDELLTIQYNVQGGILQFNQSGRKSSELNVKGLNENDLTNLIDKLKSNNKIILTVISGT